MSLEEISGTRKDFAAAMERFIKEKPQISLNLLSYSPIFALAFHNEDNRELVSQFCKMLRIIEHAELELVFASIVCAGE